MMSVAGGSIAGLCCAREACPCADAQYSIDTNAKETPEHRWDMASVTASMNKNSQWINKWLDMGQPKIVLKVPGPVELDQIKKDAITLAVPWCVIEDAGRTQIAPGTVTCLALGPAPEEHIDRITGDLKLL